jgi:hypothetical protein
VWLHCSTLPALPLLGIFMQIITCCQGMYQLPRALAINQLQQFLLIEFLVLKIDDGTGRVMSPSQRRHTEQLCAAALLL